MREGKILKLGKEVLALGGAKPLGGRLHEGQCGIGFPLLDVT